MDKMQFKYTISSKSKKINFNFKELWSYRDLISLLVKKDFVALYKQTILGPAWAIIQPLFSTIIFTIVFGKLAGLTVADTEETVILPSFIFYMAGNICWTYFSNTLNATSNTFVNNAATMGKVYYPRLVAPISSAFSQLISFAIQFVMLILIWLYYLIRGGTSIVLTPAIMLIPLTIVQMMFLSIGCGIVVASATTKYRDLRFAVSFCVTLWQYASPVAYGLAMIPEKYTFIYLLNPVSPIITTFRYALFGFGYFNLVIYLISWGITLLLFILGVLLFNRIEKTFMDTI